MQTEYIFPCHRQDYSITLLFLSLSCSVLLPDGDIQTVIILKALDGGNNPHRQFTNGFRLVGGQLILHSPVMLTEEDFSVNLINDKLNFLCHTCIFKSYFVKLRFYTLVQVLSVGSLTAVRYVHFIPNFYEQLFCRHSVPNRNLHSSSVTRRY